MSEARAKARRARAKDVAKAETRGLPAAKPGVPWWVYALAAVAAIYVAYLVYSPALGGPFLFDDTFQPYHSPGFTNSLRAWMSGVRPLLMMSYWLNYQVSAAPSGFHDVNFLIHLLNSLLIVLIVRKMLLPESTGWLLPVFAGAVFLLHPIQTESVSYVAGRSECLSVMFFLAAFAVFIYRRTPEISWKTSVLVLFLFVAGR